MPKKTMLTRIRRLLLNLKDFLVWIHTSVVPPAVSNEINCSSFWIILVTGEGYFGISWAATLKKKRIKNALLYFELNERQVKRITNISD